MLDSRLNAAWWALHLGLGIVPILTGIDKYFDKLANWGMYLSPLATKVLPISETTLMHAIGPVEIVVGLAILTRWTRWGSYVLAVWLLAIAANLVSTGMFFDLAARDVLIAIAAFTLARMAEARAASEAASPYRVRNAA